MCQLYEAQLPVFSVNVEITVRNVTINDVQLQNSNFEFGIPPILYTKSYFKQKQRINRQHPPKQACKIWRKNFQALLNNHILGVGSF